MRRFAGEWFIGIAAFHTVVGLLLGTGVLSKAGADVGLHAEGALLGCVRLGIIGSAMPKHAAEFGLLWFLFSGFAFATLGLVLRWMYRVHHIVTPSFVLWICIALSVVGIVMMPISGFWLLLGISIALLADRGGSSLTAQPG